MIPSKVKVKAVQLCLTLCDPMDYSPTGSSVHRDSPDKDTGVGCHALLQGDKIIENNKSPINDLKK